MDNKQRGFMIRESNPNYSPFDNSEEYICYCSKCYARCRRNDCFCPACGIEFFNPDVCLD